MKIVYIVLIILKRIIIYIILAILALILAVCVFYHFNILRFRHWTIVNKFINSGLNPERFYIFVKAIKVLPQYLWGGQKISMAIGDQIHDLWMDTLDCGGIISFILMIIYTLNYIFVCFKLLKNKKLNENHKVLFLTLLACIFAEFMLEPIMSGCSIFLICGIINNALIEKTLTNN